MGGFLISNGTWWDDRSLAIAHKALAHYGPPQTLVSRPRLRVEAIGAEAGSIQNEEIEAWWISPETEDSSAVLKSATERKFEKEGPSRWQTALIVVLDHRDESLTISRGEFAHETFKFAHHGGSFFAAPELKAISRVPAIDRIHVMPPGNVLSVRTNGDVPELREETRDWAHPPLNGRDYEKAQADLRDILRTAVKDELQIAPRPIALGLSGGLDSSVAAFLALECGEKLPAYTVWFDRGNGEIPFDLRYARITARYLGLEHIEVRVGADEVAALIEDTIRRSEANHPMPIEGGLYLDRLCRALRDDGFKSYLTGNGFDGPLGSFKELGNCERQEDFERVFLYCLRHATNLESEYLIRASFGIRALSPMGNRTVEKFVRSLPREFLVQGRGEDFQGKRIARDAFADALPREVTGRSKETPPATTGSKAIAEGLYGKLKNRRAIYEGMQARLLKPPESDLLTLLRYQIQKCFARK